jgi:hypothetical protein
MVTSYFADTSALSKRYVMERGSDWILNWIEPPTSAIVIVSEITIIEIRSLLARHVREGSLTAKEQIALRDDFLLHAANEYLVVLLDSTLVIHAAKLIEMHKLRTLDAIQLASAISARNMLGVPLTFLSADKNLLVAAESEGFAIEDPNAYS